MAQPDNVSAFESFRDRTFSFYPAIRNVEYNEWTYKKETWSEILVSNAKTGEEVWIPRHFVDCVSTADEPVLIVGLKRELELKGGAVWPFEKRLIEMPAPRPGTRATTPAPPGAPPTVAKSSTESQLGRLIGYTLLVGLGACLLVMVFAFEGFPHPQDWLRRRNAATKDQQYLSLTREDQYHDVVRKLGPPNREQWITPESAEFHLEALWYADRAYIVVMMGAERTGLRYIGTIHAVSRVPLDSVPLPGGGSTTSMLRALPQF